MIQRRIKLKLDTIQLVSDLIVENEDIKGVVTSYGERILGDKVIITTGGKSFPNTGSDGTMYSILESMGIQLHLYTRL